MRIVEGTIVDGPGLRTSIYVAGCTHHCPGCHNPQTWPFDAGTATEVSDIIDIVRHNDFNVTFTGGDPMQNAETLLPLAHIIVEMGYTIWCYTGYTFEELVNQGTAAQKQLLELVEVLVDGPFVESQRDTTLHFRGSSNQRLVLVAPTLTTGEIHIWSQD